MKRFSLALVLGALMAVPWDLAAQAQSGAAAQMEAADGFMTSARYREAVLAYRSARKTDDAALRVRAGVGEIRALHRIAAAYIDGRIAGAAVAAADPGDANALAAYGDALWGSALFLEAEAQYAAALAIDPSNARARHGRGRSLGAQHRFNDALADLLHATKTEPLEAAYWCSLASVYEQLRRYSDSAAALTQYVALLPKNNEDPIALAARAQVEFLRSFKTRTPLEGISNQAHVVAFRIVNGHIVVKGRLNGQAPVDLIVDTGAERVALSAAMARRAGVASVGRLETAGVGELAGGFRSMETARLDQLEIGSLRVRNVACLIKNPALPTLPTPEGEVFSPLALGLSIRVDYRRQELTMARRLPDATYDVTLPLRMTRLAVVRGVINGSSPAGFVVDTGGEATSVNLSVASRVTPMVDARRVPVRVYGMAGWDRSAFLMPFVDIDFGRGIGVEQSSVVVLNLDAPSALLGFQLGGIIGHQFLSRYTVSIDLPRSLVGLQR